MPKIPNPLGLTALPGEVTAALAQLPLILEGIREIASHTSVLHDVSEDTRTIDARMTRIEEAMPALVEVQEQLAALPETLEKLSALLVRLDDNITTLSESVEPLGRLADRFPGGNKR